MALRLEDFQAELQARQGFLLAVVGAELRTVDFEQGRLHSGDRVVLLLDDAEQTPRGILQQLSFLIGH